MNLTNFNISLLIISFVSVLWLGAFVYTRHRVNKINKIFFFLSFNIAIWIFSVFMLQISHAGGAFICWSRIAFATVVFIPPGFLLFVATLSQRKISPLRTLFAPYALATALAVVSLTHLAVKNYEINPAGEISAVYGPALPAFLAYLSIFMGGLLYYLFRIIKVHTGFRRLQFQYTFLGSLIYTILAISTGLIAPLFGLTATEIASLSPAFALIWVGFIAYAIAKYNLMDITVVIKKTTLYLALTTAITIGYIGVVLLSNWLFGGIAGFPTLFPAMIAALLIAFAFAPLKAAIQSFLDKALFKRRYDHRKILGELSKTLSSILGLEELLDHILKVIAETMGIARGAFYLRQSGDKYYLPRARLQADRGQIFQNIPAGNQLQPDFIKTREIVLREQLERMPGPALDSMLVSFMEEMGYEICIPIFFKESFSGIFFFGRKENGESFTREDIEMFATLSHQTAVAIENALLYTQVEESKIYQEILLNNLTSGVIAVNLQGKITTCNRKAGEILGIPAEEVIGKNTDVIPPEFKKPLLAALKDSKTISDEEIRIKPDGKEDVPLALSSSTFNSYDGKVLGALIVFSDLTERKTLEAEMRRADRLASLGTLAAGMAHEIKNPLVSLKTFTQLLPKKYRDREFREKFSLLAGNEVDRINNLVEQLLNFARPLAPAFCPTNIREVLENTLLLLQTKIAEKNISVKRKFEFRRLHLMADGEQLKQVFLNIIINALDSMKKHGTLTISGKVIKANDPAIPSPLAGTDISLFDARNRDRVVIEISDTGQGIRREDLPHLFDPFFTTKKSGAGLGLAIAHNIIKEHGGIIDVRSQAGAGTTFFVTLFLDNEKPLEEK